MEIKNCPFCDIQPESWVDSNCQDKFVVECADCGTQKRDEYSFESALNEWNTRPGENKDKMSNLQFLLTKLSEECNEVGQMAAKCQQFGIDEVYSGDGNTLTNRERLHGEINDLLGVIDMLNSEENFNFNPDWTAKLKKQQKIDHYREYSRDLGMVGLTTGS